MLLLHFSENIYRWHRGRNSRGRESNYREKGSLQNILLLLMPFSGKLYFHLWSHQLSYKKIHFISIIGGFPWKQNLCENDFYLENAKNIKNESESTMKRFAWRDYIWTANLEIRNFFQIFRPGELKQFKPLWQKSVKCKHCAIIWLRMCISHWMSLCFALM